MRAVCPLLPGGAPDVTAALSRLTLPLLTLCPLLPGGAPDVTAALSRLTSPGLRPVTAPAPSNSQQPTGRQTDVTAEYLDTLCQQLFSQEVNRWSGRERGAARALDTGVK